MDQAGVPERLAAAVLGHEIETMSYGLYSGGPALAQLKDAVEAVDYSDSPVL